MATYFQGAVQAGANPSKYGTQYGNAVFAQTGINANVTGLVQDISFTLPANSQILRITADTLTAYDSATSATLSVGTASGGTTYMSGVDVKSNGREAPTLSAAQLLAMANITTNTTVVATITSVGQPTAGSVRVTVEYVITE
jgi:hypothetical protein